MFRSGQEWQEVFTCLADQHPELEVVKLQIGEFDDNLKDDTFADLLGLPNLRVFHAIGAQIKGTLLEGAEDAEIFQATGTIEDLSIHGGYGTTGEGVAYLLQHCSPSLSSLNLHSILVILNHNSLV